MKKIIKLLAEMFGVDEQYRWEGITQAGYYLKDYSNWINHDINVRHMVRNYAELLIRYKHLGDFHQLRDCDIKLLKNGDDWMTELAVEERQKVYMKGENNKIWETTKTNTNGTT